jgi:hypothetical protein
MDYFGISNGIIEQGIIDLELAYSRSLNSDSVVALDNNSVVNASLIGNNVLTPVVSGEDYQTIEFDLDVEYQGTETSDKLTVSGFVANAQDSGDWSVEVYNGTNWVSSLDVILGIGESISDSTVDNSTIVKMRVNLPNLSSSISLDSGHLVNIELTGEAGVSSSTNVRVNVPQYYGMELTNVVEETGVSPGGTGNFAVTLSNTGNGDDTYTIELADNLLEGWQITPSTTSLTISKGDLRTQQFSIFAPEYFTSG